MLTMDERAALNGLSDALREMRGELARTASNSSRADININGGGVGVWIATTAALVMLACNVFLAALVIDLRNADRDTGRKLSDLDAYLAAIYMQAPHLKPVEKEK